jgi:hypothetical protein
MSKLDWDRIRENKDLHRAEVAARPFEEKLDLLERLRQRTQEMRGGHHLPSTTERSPTSNVEFQGESLSPTRGPTLSAGTAAALALFGVAALLLLVASATESSANNATPDLQSNVGGRS